MSAEGQIKAFIDRILRLKQEQDVIGDDIRDIYAEAKGMGFDKTAMGNVVAHLRKVAKKGSETVAEQGAIFDIYLAAYDGHAPAPARVRENIEKFDPLTGEFLDETQERPSNNDEACPEAGPQAEASPAGTGTGTLADREGRRDGEAASVDLPTKSEIPSDQRETDREAAATGVGANEGGDDVESSAERAGLEGGPVNLEPTGPVAEWAPNSPEEAPKFPTNPEEEAEAKGAATDDAEDRGEGDKDRQRSPEPGTTDGRRQGGVEHLTSVDVPAPSFLTKPPSPLRPNCQRPEMCAGVGRTHCHSCTKAMREHEEFA
ncbi:uncharacterized protein (UPF0335 family) [Ensifer sp. KUDG1]|uniref:DUF2312 domain-containing protein n=1 Tax=Ensifer sp. KUDG1 TaxID=3373919 RepID=UPI003D1F0583